ncbi:nucleotidyltransferase domain-containing protein [Anatilimnocola floriformis]|uniref:nucleotidyltransferase domain-containing protein n=1 Tax=Anatilimnocola floriformis TaxID=2948575 RepID=UPI0020C58DA0|nr:nucleotidyltransferase domain-containing protein [Anatilimnocola floriformis]
MAQLEHSSVAERVHQNPNLIFSIGTQVVTLRSITGEGGRILHPNGSVGVVIRSPGDLNHSYRVRFLDGIEDSLRREDLTTLAHFKEGEIGDSQITVARNDLFSRVIFRCIIGSRAYGLEGEHSDTDYRGIYLPPADLHWSLYGVPDQIDREETQEQCWELQRFLILALKANPNVLECLYTPLIENITPLGEELLSMRSSFLSRLVFQTYNGYVTSQFKKMQADIRNQGQVKWKHVMHLIRLLISGISVLRNGFVPVRMDSQREQLLAVKRGEIAWDETERWRISLHQEFEQAVQQTSLPDRPDYERANALLIKARRAALLEELP